MLQSNDCQEKYFNLITFLKENGKNYTSKKAAVFMSLLLVIFLNHAPDEVQFMFNDIVIFGIPEACCICEISQVTLVYIEDLGALLIVKLKQPRNIDRRPLYAYLNRTCTKQFYKVPEISTKTLQLKDVATFLVESGRYWMALNEHGCWLTVVEGFIDEYV
ncbi:hypothetical protein HHI36_001087 [Cryptolaemus montrouzieri]|uniref:Uncharacterized protein n=1 Tax=Cryptolaemus montrouzieri TaxID=559131 RepID=A0ABD2P7G4_9CUCU